MTTPLLVLVLLAQVSAPDLDAALRAVEEGAEPPKIAESVGALAVEAIRARPDMSTRDLDLHLQVAARGGAHGVLAPVLTRLLADDGPSLEPALRAVARLEAPARTALVTALPPDRARARVLTACMSDDGQAARGALAVVAPGGSPQVICDLLRQLVEDDLAERAGWLLEVVASGGGASAPLLEALASMAPSLPRSLDEPFAAALATFVDERPELAASLLDALRRQPSPGLLGAMQAMPPERWEEASQEVLRLVMGLASALTELDGPEAQLLGAAVRAAADLRAPELLPLLPELCRPNAPTTVRLAALRALGDVGAREAWCVDLLLTYVGEPDPIGPAAFVSLRQRTGARLPHRPVLWHNWRRQTPLPEMTPAEHARRLEAERASRYELRQRSRARAE